MSIFAELVQADKRVMSIESYYVYVCAWCCVQAGYLQPMMTNTMHATEHDIAVRGGIVFW